MGEFPNIPGFTCDGVLGRGGMAVVYSAIDLALGRRVAIKVVSPGDNDEAQHVRRLEQEARGLAALQHPHIVELHAFGRTREGALYYVMPQLHGGDLTAWSRPLPEAQLRELLDPLLGALAHAHAAGIVHRDVKPENILFDRHARPLLGDFGAAFVRGAERITDRDMAIGSSHYMSPEQARGQDVDARADLYAMGVLAWEYLTGALPFAGEDDLAIALAKVEQPVPRLPRALAHWQPFFDRALAAQPDARFASADAMRAALPLPAAPAPPRSRSRTPLLVAAAFAVVAAVAGYALWPDAAPPAVVATPPQPAVEPKRSLADAIGAPTPTQAPTQSPTPAATPRAPDGPLVALGALALTRAPIDAASYRRFLEATDRAVFDCPAAPRPAQGCIRAEDAERYAAWLSQSTGARWRLPTKAELASAAPQLDVVAARAWTTTCEERRVAQPQNVARRAWSGVRQAFGRDRLRARTSVQCIGNVAVALDGRGGDARALDRAAPDTVFVLVREGGG